MFKEEAQKPPKTSQESVWGFLRLWDYLVLEKDHYSGRNLLSGNC